MRVIGRDVPMPQLLPSARALADAAVHQATSAALAGVFTTGIRKGVYRFASHRQAQAQVREALAAVVAAAAARQHPVR